MDLLAKLWGNFTVEGSCWLWAGGTNSWGYGRICLRGKCQEQAHRVAWEIANEKPIPDGLFVLHICDVRRCINPDHLYVGTHADNMRDMRERVRHSRRHATHCKHGHLFDDANTYWRRDGCRDCRVCNRERVRRYNERCALRQVAA